MKILDLSSEHLSGSPKDAASLLCDEEPVAIFINGRHISTVLLGSGNIREYVTGYLFTEQYIKTADEIESIRVEKNRASVLTTNIFSSPGPKKTILSGCGGAVSYIDPGKLPVLTGTFTIPASTIAPTIAHFMANEERQPGLVVSALYRPPQCLMFRQDIGDDQVTDRMIGAGLIGKIDFSSTYCLCSHTVTSETVRKCLIAGIPLLLTTGHCTRLAAQIGQKNGLCIGIIQDTRLLIVSRSERITW